VRRYATVVAFFYGVGLGFLILLPKEDDEFYQ
jgi:hypothetical protein